MRAPTSQHPSYTALEERFRRLGLLGGVASLLDWDTATMMPTGGASARAEEQAALAGVLHRQLCEPELGDLIAAAATESVAPAQAANLAAMRHRWVHATAVPDRLVEEINRATALCEIAWRDARPKSDFAGLAPKLAHVLRLVRERAAAKAAALGVAPYAALLDEYNPGLGLEPVERLFADLKAFLPPLLQAALAVQAKRPPLRPLPAAAAEAQRRLGEHVMRLLGFDFEHGRLDESRHPFMSGNAEDVRITMRVSGADFVSGLLAVAHETGHALYEAGLPAPWRWQPGGDAAGSAMHEGQALLWEMQVARGRAFLSYLAPLAAEVLGVPVDGDALVRTVQHVAPGMIRVDADEVTYPLHILLRYRLERALFDGSLEVADLPGAWNDAMEALLGIRPRNDGEGCMQDIHWMLGNFGYFPSYALGVTAAAQLYQGAAAAHPTLEDSIAAGDTRPLLGWLRAHVHAHGSLLPTAEILKRATGRSFDARALEMHLRRRYVDGAS